MTGIAIRLLMAILAVIFIRQRVKSMPFQPVYFMRLRLRLFVTSHAEIRRVTSSAGFSLCDRELMLLQPAFPVLMRIRYCARAAAFMAGDAEFFLMTGAALLRILHCYRWMGADPTAGMRFGDAVAIPAPGLAMTTGTFHRTRFRFLRMARNPISALMRTRRIVAILTERHVGIRCHLLRRAMAQRTTGGIFPVFSFMRIAPLGWVRIPDNMTIIAEIGLMTAVAGIFFLPNIFLMRFDPLRGES